jgi:hypothetical protein
MSSATFGDGSDANRDFDCSSPIADRARIRFGRAGGRFDTSGDFLPQPDTSAVTNDRDNRDQLPAFSIWSDGFDSRFKGT